MDPNVIATLAGPALVTSVQFVLARVSAALDRRAATLKDDERTLVEGYAGPIAINEATMTPERMARLRKLTEILEAYSDNPEIVRSDDSRLTHAIASAYADLSALYGVKFRLPGEENSGVRVSQKLGDVERPVTGIKASGITKDANVNLSQTALRVHRDGTLVGLEIEGTIG